MSGIRRPSLFDGQPIWASILVLLSYVAIGPYMSDGDEKVFRPRFDFFSAAIVLIVLFVIPSSIGLLISFCRGSLYWFFIGYFSSVFLLIPIFIKSIVDFLINLYQRRAPASVRSLCNQVPSCSEYFRLSVKKYGFLRGGRLGWKRLRGCSGQHSTDFP